MRHMLFLTVLLSLGLTGCVGTRTYLPVNQGPVGVRVPSQQLLLADAVDQAVKGLDLKDLSGKTVVVEPVGVFPHTKTDLVDYLKSAVEIVLAKNGAKVVQKQLAPVGANYDSIAAGIIESSYPKETERKVVLAIRAGGVDYRKEMKIPIIYTEVFATGKVDMTATVLDLKTGKLTDSASLHGEATRQITKRILGFDVTTDYTPESVREPTALEAYVPLLAIVLLVSLVL